MHKKIDTLELAIPKDDVECWERYSKHRWVYDLSRLLDAQNVKWSPYETDELKCKEININLNSSKNIESGYIYMDRPQGSHIYTEVYITKGEIKLSRYLDKWTHTEVQNIIGDIDLRINAFVSMHFQKFSGIITIESIGNIIVSIHLRPLSELTSANTDIARLIKRIYKKTGITVIGLTDQVLHETIAS